MESKFPTDLVKRIVSCRISLIFTECKERVVAGLNTPPCHVCVRLFTGNLCYSLLFCLYNWDVHFNLSLILFNLILLKEVTLQKVMCGYSAGFWDQPYHVVNSRSLSAFSYLHTQPYSHQTVESAIAVTTYIVRWYLQNILILWNLWWYSLNFLLKLHFMLWIDKSMRRQQVWCDKIWT